MSDHNEVKKLRIGVIGMSKRGKSLIKGCYSRMDDVEVIAVCDVYEDRVNEAVALVQETCRREATGYTDYRDLLAREDIDAVVISSSWNTHSEIVIAALKAGKYPASEVGGAYSIEECWQLVRASEETGIPCMMLSNANYGRKELAVLNMVKQGLFGEIIHCQAGYQHDLRDEVGEGAERRHYRLANYLTRDGDIYPIHGIGPIAKYLDINRGNRFVSLTSMSSKARGLKEWATNHLGVDHPVANAHVAMGDVVMTMIKCSRGETILLVHDTTLPRPYSKCRRVQGTKGLWLEDNTSIHIEGRSKQHEWEPFEDYQLEFDHPLWKQYLVEGIRGGHNGVDYLVARAFIESIKAKQAPPIDVYDMAAWMAITALSERSVALGGQAVAFPDFTNGKWINRGPGPSGKYSLDTIDESFYQ